METQIIDLGEAKIEMKDFRVYKTDDIEKNIIILNKKQNGNTNEN
jgi:hypothetical protein